MISKYFHYTDIGDIAHYTLEVLRSELGDQVEVVDPLQFTVSHGSTAVTVSLVGEDEVCIIDVNAPIAFHVPATAELFEYIAMNGDRLGLPVLSLTESGHPGLINVNLRHRILGNCLDRGELLASVYAVAHISDTIDEGFVDRFGGQRWIDLHRYPV